MQLLSDMQKGDGILRIETRNVSRDGDKPTVTNESFTEHMVQETVLSKTFRRNARWTKGYTTTNGG